MYVRADFNAPRWQTYGIGDWSDTFRKIAKTAKEGAETYQSVRQARGDNNVGKQTQPQAPVTTGNFLNSLSNTEKVIGGIAIAGVVLAASR